MTRKSTSTKRTSQRWSGEVTTHSNALDLDKDVFTWTDPHKIATSLKHSAEHSQRRKGTPFQSAMSMLTFYINRAGDNLARASAQFWSVRRRSCGRSLERPIKLVLERRSLGDACVALPREFQTLYRPSVLNASTASVNVRDSDGDSAPTPTI